MLFEFPAFSNFVFHFEARAVVTSKRKIRKILGSFYSEKCYVIVIRISRAHYSTVVLPRPSHINTDKVFHVVTQNSQDRNMGGGFQQDSI